MVLQQDFLTDMMREPSEVYHYIFVELSSAFRGTQAGSLEMDCLCDAIEFIHPDKHTNASIQQAINISSIALKIFNMRLGQHSSIPFWRRTFDRIALKVHQSVPEVFEASPRERFMVEEYFDSIDLYDVTAEKVACMCTFEEWRNTCRPEESPFSDFLVSTLMRIRPGTEHWRVRRLAELSPEDRAAAANIGEENAREPLKVLDCGRNRFGEQELDEHDFGLPTPTRRRIEPSLPSDMQLGIESFEEQHHLIPPVVEHEQFAPVADLEHTSLAVERGEDLGPVDKGLSVASGCAESKRSRVGTSGLEKGNHPPKTEVSTAAHRLEEDSDAAEAALAITAATEGKSGSSATWATIEVDRRMGMDTASGSNDVGLSMQAVDELAELELNGG